MKRRKYPSNGHRYTIKLFFRTEEITAIYQETYTDLFGCTYSRLFMDEKGNIFELSEVESWILTENNHTSPRRP